jgi:uncharacterized tellurite resistance protein B-like protein
MKKYAGLLPIIAVLWLMGVLAKNPEILWAIGLFLLFIIVVIIAAKRTTGSPQTPPPTPKPTKAVKQERAQERGERATIRIEIRPTVTPGSDKPQTSSAPAATQSVSTSAPGYFPEPGLRSQARWIPYGEEVTIGAFKVRGGGFYVQDRSTRDDAPGTIIRSLDVDPSNPDWNGANVGYYPTYEGLRPNQRAAFLAFLDSNRKNPQIPSYCLWLLYYNIEHRLLTGDPGVIAAEVEQHLAAIRALQAIATRTSSSMDNYGNGLVAWICHHYPVQTARFETAAPKPPARQWDEGINRTLGRVIARGGPLPPDWAFQCAYLRHPKASNATWSAVLPEMRALFSRAYRASYPAGYTPKPAATRIRLEYRPAARAGDFHRVVQTQWPDMSRVDVPFRPLVAMLEQVLGTLEPLRKARRSSTVNLMGELAVYPLTLAKVRPPEQLAGLATAVQAHHQATPHQGFALSQVFDALQIPQPEKLAKKDALAASRVMALLGYGMEPDPRFSGGVSTGKVWVFTVDEPAAETPTPAFAAALIMVQSLMGVAMAGGGVAAAEREAILQHLASQFALTPDENARLHAISHWLEEQPKGLGRVESKLKLLPTKDREALASALVAIANADGHVDAGEVRLLERLYQTLEIDPKRLHADLHHAAVGGKPSGIAAATTAANRPVPALLDADAIARKLEESARIQSVLAGIFETEHPLVISETPADLEDDSGDEEDATNAPTEAGALTGVRGEIGALVTRAFPTPAPCDRTQWDGLCSELGLMPEGALEEINAWAIERFGDPLLEDADGEVLIDPAFHAEIYPAAAPTPSTRSATGAPRL